MSIAQTGPESGAPLLSWETLLAPLRPRFAFIIATLLMTVLLLVQTQSQIPFFAEFQKDSEYILTGSITASRDLGFDFVGGFMTSPDPLVHRAAVTRIEPGLADRQYLPYISDSGLQYKILWLFAPPSADQLTAYFTIMRAVMTLVFALVMVWWISGLVTEFGLLTGIATFFGVVATPLLVAMSPNLFYFFFLFLLPMIVVWRLYEPARDDPRRFRVLAALIGVTMAAKAMCGYEYGTNALLGILAPIAYFEVKHAAGLVSAVRLFVRRGLILGLCGGAGILVAVVVQVAQAARWFGSLSKGIMAFAMPAFYNTVVENGIRPPVPSFDHLMWVYNEFLKKPVFVPVFREFSSYGVLKGVAILVAAAAVAWALRRVTGTLPARDAGYARRLAGLAVAAFFAILASVSWMVAAKHMMAHFHLNAVIFTIPALPVLYALAGASAGGLLRFLSPAPLFTMLRRGAPARQT